MLDKDLILVIGLAKLIAVNEYLRERGNEQVCSMLDGIIKVFRLYCVIQNKNKSWKCPKL